MNGSETEVVFQETVNKSKAVLKAEALVETFAKWCFASFVSRTHDLQTVIGRCIVCQGVGDFHSFGIPSAGFIDNGRQAPRAGKAALWRFGR